MKTLLVSLLLISQACWSADVFKWTDEKGNINFGDQPGSNAAESIELKKPTVYSAPDLTRPLTPTSGLKEVDVANYRIAIISPTREQSIRNAEGKLPVLVRVEPQPEGEQDLLYRFSLDGTVVTEGKESGVQLAGIDRGTHQIEVSLVDSKGRQLATSGTVTFHFHRPFIKRKSKPASVPVPKNNP